MHAMLNNLILVLERLLMKLSPNGYVYEYIFIYLFSSTSLLGYFYRISHILLDALINLPHNCDSYLSSGLLTINSIYRIYILSMK